MALLSLLLLLSSDITAADVEKLCKSASTTPEINECGRLEHLLADQKLNAAYQAALKVASTAEDDSTQAKETRASLVKAQRLWIQFRDADCDAVYNLWRGGTIRGAMYWGCMLGRTEQRTKELELFNYQEH